MLTLTRSTYVTKYIKHSSARTVRVALGGRIGIVDASTLPQGVKAGAAAVPRPSTLAALFASGIAFA